MDRRRLSPWAAIALDVALAVGFGGFGVWRELSRPVGADWPIVVPHSVYAAAEIVGALLLLARRRHPLTVGVATALLCLLAPIQTATVAVYSVAAHAAARVRAAVAIVAVLLAWGIGGHLWELDDKISGPLVLGFALVLGLYVRARRGLYDALVERAVRAEREQQLLAEQAVDRERSRLAGEMHDVVSHRLSLMLLQAGALTVTEDDPDAQRAVEELRANGVAALTELREVFGTLRTSSEPMRPPESPEPAGSPELPGHERTEAAGSGLPELVEEWQRVGTTVSLAERGDVGRLDPSIRRTAYRIAQEALTNAAKHAAGAPVQVEADYGEGGVRVRIRSGLADGPADEQLRDSGGGAGLAGLDQRVQLLGGSLVTGFQSDGGFEVLGRLPTTVPVDADVEGRG